MNDNERMLLRAVVDNDQKKAQEYARVILTNITAQRDQYFKAELLRKLDTKPNFIELPYNLKDLLVAEDVTDYPMGKFLMRSGEEAIANKILAIYRASNRLMELGISYLPAAILYGQSGTGKTELARRGGLGWSEALAIIEGKSWKNAEHDENVAEGIVRKRATEFMKARG